MVGPPVYETVRIQSDTERYSWAGYLLFVAISSIFGDSLIILASRSRNSFRLNKCLVTIMQHIAVCDISVSITHILPSAISLIADSWLLGNMLCYVRPYLQLFFTATSVPLICLLTTGKYLLLSKPVRARNWSRKQAHLICSVVWVFTLVYPILMYTLGKDDVNFDYRTYSCEYGWNAYTWRRISPITSFVSAILPNTVVITTTIPTLRYLIKARNAARRTKKSMPWQGALTVSLTAIVYCLSTMPISVYFFCYAFMDREGWRYNLLYRYGMFLGMINFTSNFFIYAMTIRTFRRYLLSSVEKVLSYLTNVTRRRQKIEPGS